MSKHESAVLAESLLLTMRRDHLLRLAGGGSAILLLIGCASGGTGPSSDHYLVSAPQTSFYKYGPAQAFGADGILSQGQRVKMLSREFGFSRVMLVNGQSGYVATDDLKPAPPLPKATPPPKLIGASSGRIKRSGPEPESVSAPLFDLSDVPAPPLPRDAEKPESSPTFRY